MIVQIYEIQTPAEAEAMIALDVDHLGSVMVCAQTWQDPVLKQTIDVVQASGRKSSLIPLFRDVDPIVRAIDYYRPDIVHFCEAMASVDTDNGIIAEMLERQRLVRRRFPQVAIMRSIPIGMNGCGKRIPSLQLAALFESCSDWFLTDTVLFNTSEDTSEGVVDDQPVQGFVGITGETCDWSVARDLVCGSRIPVILAGGIGPSNVRDGIEQVRPAGVDSCTRTNAKDARGCNIRFKKDPEKVRALVRATRETTGRILTS
jgi:phosphoribosylanthranilate isomerase